MSDKEACGAMVGAPLPDAAVDHLDGTRGPVRVAPGRRLVLFTFPRADTPGCTAEAVAFSAVAAGLADRGVDVLGVSRDPVAKLRRFADRRGLSIALASDADGDLTGALGLWVEKQMYGRRTMGLERATLVVDDQGRITRAWRRVRVAGHVDEVLATIDEA